MRQKISTFFRPCKFAFPIVDGSLAVSACGVPYSPVFACKTWGAPPPSLHFPQSAIASDSADLSRSPKYIVVRMKQPMTRLIAGESGSFELEARLIAPGNVVEKQTRWDRKAVAPLVVHIAAPEASGNAFVDRLHPNRPYRHILVTFELSSRSDFQPLTARVEYLVPERKPSLSMRPGAK